MKARAGGMIIRVPQEDMVRGLYESGIRDTMDQVTPFSQDSKHSWNIRNPAMQNSYEVKAKQKSAYHLSFNEQHSVQIRLAQVPKLNLGPKKQESLTEQKQVNRELDFSRDKKLELLTEVARFRFLIFYFGVMILTSVMATFYGV